MPDTLPEDLPHGLRLSGADQTRFALIERGAAWSLAASVLGGARIGTGSVLLVEGASGLGKTPLVTVMMSLALESGMQVLSATGRNRERKLRYGVIMQLAESGLRREDAVSRAPFAGEGAPVLGQRAVAIPALDDLRGLYRMCLNVARAAPLVLLVDDADLADEPSLEALLYLAERIADEPVALVLTAGASGLKGSALLGEVARHPSTTRCRLSPLSPEGTKRRLAKRWPAFVTDEVVDEIYLASGGNPFVVDALAEVLVERGEQIVAGAIEDLAPETLADWVLARGDLDPSARAFLMAVAVLGQGCELRHAAALANLGCGAAAALLDRLVAAEILLHTERIAFAQPAVGAALRRAQPAGERAAGNLRAARLLAAEDVASERVACHLLHASRTGSAWTVDALCVAAAVAMSRGAPGDAVRYLARALDEPPPLGKRAHVVLELGRAEAAAGNPDAGLHLSAAVRQAGQMIGGPLPALEAGRTLVTLGKAGDAIAAFGRGLEVAPSGDLEVAARLRAGQTAALWFAALARGEAPAPLPPVPDAAASPSDRSLMALHAADAAIRGVPATEVRTLAEQALGRGALLQEETPSGLPYYCAVAALAFAEELQTAEAALTAAIHDAQSQGSVLGFAIASRLRARTILMRGRLTDAALDVRHALAVEHRDWQMGRGGARAILAAVLLEQGDLERARRYLDEADALAEQGDPLRVLLLSVRGRLELNGGDPTTALKHFLRCGKNAEKAGAVNPAVVEWRAYAGRATAATGDLTEGMRLIETELSQAKAFGAPGQIARTMRALASVSDPAAALEILEAAVKVLHSSQAALERATAMVDFGAALRRSGKRRDAVPMLLEGLDLAKRCGADALVSRAKAEAATAGARPRRTALRGREALTQRERQVASLAADGHSNREIAEKLVVTVKTVEWHLRHAYAKLGVKSRRELAGKLDKLD